MQLSAKASISLSGPSSCGKREGPSASSLRGSSGVAKVVGPPVRPALTKFFFQGLNVTRSERLRYASRLPVRAKMIVPGFGEKSPEAKAADSLHNFFTYIAVRVVLSQLQAYNPEGYQELRAFTDTTSLKDGDQFCAALMREGPRHKQLAMRILEVRKAYAFEDFEWENLQMLSIKRMDDGNKQLMCEYLMETSRFD